MEQGVFPQLGRYTFGHGCLGISRMHFPSATETPCNKIEQLWYISWAWNLEYMPTSGIPKTGTIKKPEKEYQF